MLRSHRALFRYKTDYGSCVYGPSKKSKLSAINPVHNTEIRLATGAFRTSRLQSLHEESGEPPLTVLRNLFCNYVSRLATQPAPLPPLRVHQRAAT